MQTCQGSEETFREDNFYFPEHITSISQSSVGTISKLEPNLKTTLYAIY